MSGFNVRPAEVPGMGFRWDYDDGRGLMLSGFAATERRALRQMRRRVRRYWRQHRQLTTPPSGAAFYPIESTAPEPEPLSDAPELESGG